MGILSQLSEQPWTVAQARLDDAHSGGSFKASTPRVAFRFLLAVIGVLFGLALAAYAHQIPLAGHGGHAGHAPALPDTWLLWLNTTVLVLSSVGMEAGSRAARHGEAHGMRAGMFIGGALAIAFIIGQLALWQQLIAAGYYASVNPAYAFFYMLTGLHGLHLAGGLVALAWTGSKAWRRPARDIALSVELCAHYWHFLLLVWLAVFSLLLLS